MMKLDRGLVVMGSRSRNDERVKILLLECIAAQQSTHLITCGEPDGVSKVARDVAKELAMPLLLHFLNFRYLRGAFEKRGIAALKSGVYAIFIHDGTSKGTANELAVCKKMGMAYEYHVLEPTPYRNSVGFDIPVGERWGEDLETLLDELPNFESSDQCT